MWYSLRKTALCIGTLSVLLSGAAMATGGYSSGYSGGYGSGGSRDCSSGGSTPACDSWGGALTYDMYNESTGSQNVDFGYSTTSSTVVVDGVSIQVSAWSDTGNFNGGYYYGNYYGQDWDGSGAYGEEDSTVQSASFSGPWSSSQTTEVGYGIQNQENYGDSHSIDNLRSDNGATDYDMVLFSFSEAVSLSGATFSWLGSAVENQEVTVAGLSDISALTSGNSTWGDIANSISSDLKGSFIIEDCDDVFQSTFTTTGTAQYWLVGAYNAAFAYVDSFSKKNDSFKLASIGFTKDEDDDNGDSEPVNAPGSFALLVLAGAYAGWRRKQQA